MCTCRGVGVVNFSFCANKKIIFGWNSTGKLVPLLREYAGKCLILTGKSVRKNPLWNSLEIEMKNAGISFQSEQISGEPSPELIDSLCSVHRKEKPSAVVALGGGSVLDAGKAVSAMLCEEGSVTDFLESVGTREPSGNKVPFLALPTTAGTGSECTKNAVLSRIGTEGFKKSLRHDNYIPDLALIDPRWLESLPGPVAASCGLDAFCQLLESYLSTGASPVTDALAEEGLTGFLQSFRSLLEGTPSQDEYEAIALGASLSGLTLANAGLGTVHGLAGTLGGMAGIPHGTACGLLLAPVMERTFTALSETGEDHPALVKAAGLGQFLSGEMDMDMGDAVELVLEEISDWTEMASLPRLGSYGFTAEMLETAAQQSGNKNNPHAFSADERLDLLKSLL